MTSDTVDRRRRHLALAVAILTSLAAVDLSIHGQSGTDPFARVAFLVGRWEGTAEGQPGKGTARREYSTALRGRFIRAVQRVEYRPTEKHPNGEVHEDEGFFSFDRSRKRLVFRQFHVEGFVNSYVEHADGSPTTIVFTTEAIENIPTGFQARETYTVLGPDEFEELFEIAEPGKGFATYSRTRLKRVK